MAAKPPHVLMTADTLGGVWNHAVELACALGERGVQVTLATMGAPLSAQQRAQLSTLHAPALHESAWKLEWMQEPWADVDRAGQWLLALEREVAPDLVHLNQFAFGALPFAAPTLVVAHSCVLSWWRAVHGEPAPASWDEYRGQVARGLAGASLVAAPTRAMFDSLAENHGFSGAGRVLPNGRSAGSFRPAAKQPFIFAAGRLWDAAKNLAALQAVAPDLPWPVRVAGSTAHPDQAASPVPCPSSASESVRCLGELPPQDLALQLAEASIYALPARYEPFGLSVLEAALSGCALVLGDIASLREIWGPAALYVAPDDHDALRATLRRLTDNADERSRLANTARTRALHFSIARMADAYLGAYGALHSGFTATAAREMQCA
jgi:glycogen synthase